MWAVATHHIRRMSQASKSLLKLCATCGRQIAWRKKWEVGILISCSFRRHRPFISKSKSLPACFRKIRQIATEHTFCSPSHIEAPQIEKLVINNPLLRLMLGAETQTPLSGHAFRVCHSPFEKADQLSGKSACSDSLLTCEHVEAYVLAERGNVLDYHQVASMQSQEAIATVSSEQGGPSPGGLRGAGEESETGEERSQVDPARDTGWVEAKKDERAL
jgi:hypothetical protein